MAIHPKRERPNRQANTEKTSDAPRSHPSRSPLALIVLATLALVIWLLPSIVAKTPLLQWGLKMATADLNGSVAVQSASLGWFSPVAVEGVEVKDADGKSVLVLPAASGDRWLVSILCNYTKLGRFRLDSPKLSLVLRDDGSNAEDLLAKYLAPKEEKSSTAIGLALEIVDGGIAVTDERTGRSWQVQKLAASFEMSDRADGPLEAKLSADLPDARRPGKITVGVKMATGGNAASLNVADLPLAMFRPIAARFSPGAVCDGRLSSNATASWGGRGTGENSVQADLNAEAFSMTASALQTDVVQLERLRAVCQASWRADRVKIEKSSVDCDLGNVSLTSAMQLGQKDGGSMQSLLHEQYELSGQIDLARLARLLPATLRLHRDVEINSGQMQVAFSSRPEQPGMKWHGQLEAANLTATASGRQIAWQRPMSLLLDAHETPAGPVVDALQCESDFLKIHAAGTPDALAASMSFNLKRLSDQLGQFVDLGTIQLAGEGQGNLNWKRSPQQRFDAEAEIRLQNFQLATPNQQPWRENDLTAMLSAQGQTNLGVETRIDAATVSVKAGEDQFDVRLAQPVKDLRNGGAWPVHVQAQGQLQNWPSRLAAWLPMQNCRFTGAYAMDADATASSQNVDLRQIRLAAAPLIVASPWLNMNEPRLDVAAAGSWNQPQRRLQIEPASLTCATALIQANNIVWAMPDKGPTELAGTLKYQGDMARIRGWLSDPQTASTWRLAGQLGGIVQLNQTAGAIRGETTAEISNLAVVDATGQQFQEPRIRLVASGDYDNKSQVVQIQRVELTSDVIGANAAGRISPISGINNADIKGQIGCDMERLAGLLRPYLGSGVRMMGRSSSEAFYRGPFSLATGQAAAGLRWDAANVYGLQLGPGELKAAMANGLLRIEPIDLPVSQGRIHLAPTVRLTSSPMELNLPKGPLAQQIQVDPNVCASMLKYVIPNAADATTAKGSFSIDLEDCRIPLSNPGSGEVVGRFIIHSMDIGSGPLTQTLAVFLGRESPAKLRPESVVQFHMVNRRVYHDGLELIFPEFSVRTKGWVGFDQTMSLVAEMPVPPKWVAQNPTLSQAMRNQIVSVPIGGTLSKPQLDQKAMADLSRKFLEKAAQNVIEGEVNKQLDRLFGPKK